MNNFKGNPFACSQFSITVEAQKNLNNKKKMRSKSNPLQTQFLFLTCNDKKNKFEEKNIMDRKECALSNKKWKEKKKRTFVCRREKDTDLKVLSK